MSSAGDISVFINAVCDLCGVGICYYDLSEFFNYDRLGVRNNRGHYCAFCELARTLPGGRAQCEASDKQRAVQLAAQYREPFFFECHMGMRELVVPLLNLEDCLVHCGYSVAYVCLGTDPGIHPYFRDSETMCFVDAVEKYMPTGFYLYRTDKKNWYHIDRVFAQIMHQFFLENLFLF